MRSDEMASYVDDGRHLAVAGDSALEVVGIAATVVAFVVLACHLEGGGRDFGVCCRMMMLCTTWDFIVANSASLSLAGLLRIFVRHLGLAHVVEERAHGEFADFVPGSRGCGQRPSSGVLPRPNARRCSCRGFSGGPGEQGILIAKTESTILSTMGSSLSTSICSPRRRSPMLRTTRLASPWMRRP